MSEEPIQLGQVRQGELPAVVAWAREHGVELGQVAGDLSVCARRGEQTVGVALFQPGEARGGRLDVVVDASVAGSAEERLLVDKALRKLGRTGRFRCRVRLHEAAGAEPGEEPVLWGRVNWLKQIASGEQPAGAAADEMAGEAAEA